MKKMKSILALILALVMALSLVACGGGNEGGDKDGEKLKIALVLPGVGSTAPYDIYIWDKVENKWKNHNIEIILKPFL